VKFADMLAIHLSQYFIKWH